MARLLVPSLGVLLLLGLIGCGGGGGASFDIDPDTTAGTSSGNTSSGNGGTVTDLRAPVGTYSATLAGNNNASTAVAFGGTASAVTVGTGTIDLTFSSVTENGTPVTRPRRITATIAADGTVSVPTTTIDGVPQTVASATWTRSSVDTYVLTIKTSNAGVVATDVYTLKVTSVTFSVTGTRTDSSGRAYTASNVSAVLSAGNAITLNYTLRRFNGVSTNNGLVTTLQSGGTISPGTLSLGTNQTTQFTGSWSTNANGSINLNFQYLDRVQVPTPTVTERLVLTKN